MEAIALSVEPRQERGKEAAGRLRRDGKVPCVFYGPDRDTVAVCVDAREFLYKVR